MSLGAVEWPTVGLLLVCYGLWFATASYLYPLMPAAALAVLAVVIALHSSLQHEVLHGHPTRNRHLNEWLVGLPLGVFYPYRRYRAVHLRHHADERLTDPYDDPECYYRAQYDWEKLPRALKMLLRWNNTLVGRVTLGPALAVPGFLVTEVGQFGSSPSIRKAWMLHAAGLAVLAGLLEGAFGISFWLYAVSSAYGGMSIICIRSYCEHQWSERPEGRTVIVEKSWLALLFLNNNLHLVHHKRPTAPWYKLKALYAEESEAWRAMNEGYVFRNYFEIFRAFALRPKEPVVHPVLRRAVPSSKPGHAITVELGNTDPAKAPGEGRTSERPRAAAHSGC
ncbi:MULTISPECIES: fatty acid desaturase [Rhodomicrobium]|uniref:fatty acid desaturase n=1 Tax=Rhodomicrobium TaxID=1068 RepID=UPI001FDA54EF|nr:MULTISPECIES: fatty acid desaturase [Rhodomicrobium]